VEDRTKLTVVMQLLSPEVALEPGREVKFKNFGIVTVNEIPFSDAIPLLPPVSDSAAFAHKSGMK
jgi:hypothetical protein